MNMQQIGQTAAELMEGLETSFDGCREVQVGMVAVVVECNFIDEDGDLCSTISFRCNDGRRWMQKAIFHAAADAVDVTKRRPRTADDEE